MMNRLLRFVRGLLSVSLSVFWAYAQNAPPADNSSSHVHATLVLSSGATQYRQGELIEITIRFTTDQPETFEFRSTGRKNRWSSEATEEFHVIPADKTVDPLAAYGSLLSDIRGVSKYQEFLFAQALQATLTLPLTDWVRFSIPGRYKISVRTSGVYARNGQSDAPGTRLSLDTNQVEFEIVPADAVWQARQLNEMTSQEPMNWPAIRALGTAEAARSLARLYRPDINPLDGDVLLGLLGSPHKQAGEDEMRRLLRDPDYGVTPSFLDALALLDLPPQEATWPAVQGRLPVLRHQLRNALSLKHGPALATSTQTYIAGLEQRAGVKLPPNIVSKLQQIFEQLPPFDQDLWLGQRWTQVTGSGWLPLLQRLAWRDLNLRAGNPDLDSVRTISAMALKRLYELDPAAARERILSEIVSPAPRFGADGLGILPDRTLPEQEHRIAQNFALLSNPGTEAPTRANLRELPTRRAEYEMASSHLASLLFRYGDRDVLPEFLPVLKKRLVETNCFEQLNALAFLIKVDPEQADPLLRTLPVEQPGGQTPCAPTIYSQIGRLIASPVIERFAIASLNDPDFLVATEALRYLRDRGSAQAERPIFERLVRWNARWRDHVSELKPVSGQLNWEISFGRELAETLVIGHGWLADEARIRQIASLTLGPLSGGELEAYLEQAKENPIRIHFMGSAGIMFIVGQYQLDSVGDLKNKLSQYPPGAVFTWADGRSATYDVMDHQVLDEISEWGGAKGVHIGGR